jgi:spermidine dehydrogenase
MENEDVSRARDRELGMDRNITRRDFLNGIAVGIGAIGIAGRASGATFAQDQPGYYPPTLTGMRGSHDGSYEYAHALRDGNFWKTASRPTNTREVYDLVIAGCGISGLAAAYFYRKQNPQARILILDNHDDFGGHAKRNEFHIGRSTLITNGGTAGIESPFDYSREARGLLTELGIEPQKLQAESQALADRTLFAGLQSATFFDKETFGEDRLVIGAPGGGGRGGRGGKRGGGAGQPAIGWKEWLAKTPFSEQAQRDIARLQEDQIDYMPGLTSDEKKDKLSLMSYKDFLLKVVKVDPSVIPYYQKRTHGLYGVGIDAVAALEVWPGYPGFQGLKLEPGPFHRLSFTAMGRHIPKTIPYNYHYPDGNASIARALVRSLVPGSAPGHTPEDIVMAKFDYSKLDKAENQVKIRLSSTVLRARHVGDPAKAKEVEVIYGREKALYSVRGKAVVLACWNMMIPYLCEELPEKQKEALKYGVKVPLCYIAIGLRNWQAFQKMGIRGASAPGMYTSGVNLEAPTRIGEYLPEIKTPDDPVLARTGREPCKPGLSARDQQRVGHAELLSTPFSTFERNIRDQMARILGPGGFDPARDIEAITVNRWPHGYAYEYNYLWDPEFPKGESPCEIGRKRFGRITIANSDAAAAAYTDQAIDQGYRAVQELMTA